MLNTWLVLQKKLTSGSCDSVGSLDSHGGHCSGREHSIVIKNTGFESSSLGLRSRTCDSYMPLNLLAYVQNDSRKLGGLAWDHGRHMLLILALGRQSKTNL